MNCVVKPKVNLFQGYTFLYKNHVCMISIYIDFNLCISNLFNILCSLIFGHERALYMNTVKVLFNAAWKPKKTTYSHRNEKTKILFLNEMYFIYYILAILLQ